MDNEHMLLELDHISKIYGDLHAVDDLSLTVPQGQWLAIVGSSGSGKTTLMNMIGCMDTPSKGSVMLEGRRLEDLNARQLADVRKNMIGLVFQKFYLVPHLTAVENVMVAQYYHSVVDEKQAMEALERVGLKERAHHLPGQLSGGEQQRSALAKVLLTEPKLLLLDEPTKGLDSFFKRQLAGLLRRLMTEEGVTIVMVSHDVEFCAEYADSVSMFFDGQLLTTNTPRRFFAQNSFYTTAANRMSRHLFPQAVTAEDVVTLMKENQLT